MSDSTDREKEIFNQALEMPSPESRNAFLQGACGRDQELRNQIDALLRAYDSADGFIPDKGPGGTIRVDAGPAELPGTVIGRYKLLQQIGEGGMGVVYMAEQTEPVVRKVALKIIKLGMDTRNVIARFEAERQALALMDHPNIAEVLDAGATDSGRPYFVMELVRGVPITEYCDKNKLPPEERLALFIPVCQAIQHAHQKGIIHRDIKPSNVMVTLHDGKPVPRVIDFGIAKATNQRLTEKTLFTNYAQMIGTPAYMSPEQAEMSGLDVDTRTDVYSLGVLLYELLTGTTPFPSKELLSLGYGEMQRVIAEVEPPKPSTRLSTMEHQERTVVARNRSVEGSALAKVFRGDLDWIVMKAIEKDRSHRYDTANGLALDVQRHLKTEPVIARPATAMYRLQKLVRRNKLVFAAGAAVAVALALGLTLAMIGWSQSRLETGKAIRAKAAEEQQRKMAQSSEQKAHSVALAARQLAYSSDMNLAQQALAMNNLGRALMLLNRQRPQPGQKDLRGWEWRYLWSQTRADEHEIILAETNRLYNPLSISADGRLLARVDRGETVVTDLMSRRTVFQRTNAMCPVFTHHGANLAFSHYDPTSTRYQIILLDMASQSETEFVTSLGPMLWIGLSPDDGRLFTISIRPRVELSEVPSLCLTAWDIAARKQLWQRTIGYGAGAYREYAISPDGSAVAAAISRGGQPRAQIFETLDGSERLNVKLTGEFATVVTFSPDSATLLTSAGFTDSTIQLWDAHSGKSTGTLDGHRSFVSDLLFTPDGRRLISSSGDQTIRLWDWPTRQPAGILRGHLNEVDGLALAPDGRTLASRCKDGSIYLWDVTKTPLHPAYQTLPDNWKRGKIEFTSDSRSVFQIRRSGGTRDYELVFRDLQTLQETHRPWPFSTTNEGIFLSPDARQGAQFDFHGRLQIWDTGTGVIATKHLAPTNYLFADFSRDWNLFVTGRSNGTNLLIEAWDTATMQRKGSIVSTFDDPEDIRGTPRPDTFAIVNYHGFEYFNAARLDETPKQFESDGQFWDFAVSPDGRIAAGAYDNGVQLWDTGTREPVGTLKGFLLSTHSVAFSPDGRRIAAGSNGREAVKLWDAESLQEVLTLSGEGSVFQYLTFSPDGRHIMASNLSGVVHLWSAPSWEEIAAAEAEGRAEIKEP